MFDFIYLSISPIVLYDDFPEMHRSDYEGWWLFWCLENLTQCHTVTSINTC